MPEDRDTVLAEVEALIEELEDIVNGAHQLRVVQRIEFELRGDPLLHEMFFSAGAPGAVALARLFRSRSR